MPYNTAPIPPRKEATGTTQLPRKTPPTTPLVKARAYPFSVSRVKKMIQVDSDIHACSNSAAFVITVATVSFYVYYAREVVTDNLNRRCSSNISLNKPTTSSVPRRSLAVTSNTAILVQFPLQYPLT